MVELTIKVPDDTKAWLESKVEGGPFDSIDHAMRYALREQRERDEPGFVYSEQDIEDMLNEASASGSVAMPSVEEIMDEAMRQDDEPKQS
ncbi:MAG: hypothetical protein P0Y65_18895 [Candidatus Devosia phytovorans]|uniref:Type II toxin-antitoxin system ParD family antitoxin n=1 Tax=Candidatus Devosia phytovorans TaxID=3121372 RepID=A0AAJ6B171_9HYPH|nr:hypothetical protein [Devosia sp.]WEK04223.1 MAG: hypothetical protein P0Y65_18895 [Devosia sp.]